MKIAKEVDTGGGEKVKTRAYDFALPYKISPWGRKVLIQSQYYAGDSGSVSHKNVDQTTAARQEAKKTVGTDARFVEYVDGAGFFASLNGDLESLLAMPDTASFIQLRSTPIRLRRELQHVGFLTPLEIEHAILTAGTERKTITAALLADGYQQGEIDRAIGEAIAHGFLVQPDADHLDLVAVRRDQAAPLFAPRPGRDPRLGAFQAGQAQPGYVLVPGYGPFHGMKATDLHAAATGSAPTLAADWPNEETFRADLAWLAGRGYAIVNP